MTFNIDWELDESEERATAASLLGNITLSDNTRSIVENSVYLDSWLEALLRATKLKIAPNTETAINIIEESHPVRLVRNDDELRIVTRGKEVVAGSRDSFRNAVRSAATRFLKRTEVLEDAPKNIVLSSIRKMLEESRSVKDPARR